MIKWPSPFPLKDENWTHLKSIIELPDEARIEFCNILGSSLYLSEVESNFTQNSLVKLELVAIRKKAEALRFALRKIENAGNTEHGQLLMALISPMEAEEEARPDHNSPAEADKAPRPFDGLPPPRLTAARSLAKHIEVVESLITWIRSTEDRVPREKTGNKTAFAHTLTEGIDIIICKYRQDGRNGGLRREAEADEDFLEYCIKLVGFKQKPGTLIRALSRKRKGKVVSNKI